MRTRIVWCVMAIVFCFWPHITRAAENGRMPRKIPGVPTEIINTEQSPPVLWDQQPQTLDEMRLHEARQELKSKYKVWGAIAVAKTGMHQKDITIVNMFLNEVGWETAKEKSYKDCTDRKIGPCTVATFPGCLYVGVGRRLKEKVPVFGFNSNPEILVKECKEGGFQCAPPIGGCNYVDDDGRNAFTHNSVESPIVTSQWLLDSED